MYFSKKNSKFPTIRPTTYNPWNFSNELKLGLKMYSYLEFYIFGGVCTFNHTHKSILCVIFWIYYVCQMRKYFNPHTYVEIFITLWQMWRQGFHLFVTQVLVIKISRYLSKSLFSLVNRKVLFANYVKTWLLTYILGTTRKLSCHVNFILRECIKGINIVRQEKKEDTRENWKNMSLRLEDLIHYIIIE